MEQDLYYTVCEREGLQTLPESAIHSPMRPPCVPWPKDRVGGTGWPVVANRRVEMPVPQPRSTIKPGGGACSKHQRTSSGG